VDYKGLVCKSFPIDVRIWVSTMLRTYCFLLAGVLISCCDFASAQESRIWTDITGKHEIKAKFIDVTGGVVRLERPNGDITRIPLDKLSKADQEIIKNGQSSSPFTDENPGDAASAAAPSGPRGLQIGDKIEVEHFRRWELGVVIDIDYEWEHVDVKLADGDTARSNRVDDLRYPGTHIKPILIEPPSPESALKTIRPNYDDMLRQMADGKPKDRITADPAPTMSASWQPRSVRLAGTDSIFESPSDFEIAPSGLPTAMIIYENGHGRNSFPRVDLLDMQKRKVVASGPAPRGSGQLAMSPSGQKVVTLPGEHPGSDDQGLLNFWKIAGSKVEHIVGFAPYVMNTWPDLVPTWSMWLDENRLFTVNREGQLILWDVNTAKAEYELMLEHGATPTLTPGHKYLVVPTSSGIQFYLAKTGDFEAVIGAKDFTNAALAFSPSGKQLAFASHGFIDIVDVTTGQNTRSFPYEEKSWVRGLGWVDENFLFTDQGMLIHVPLRIIAWKYDVPHGVVVRQYAGKFWMLAGDRRRNSQVLTPIEVPPREALDAIKGLDAESLLAVKPGATVSIDVQIPEDNFLAENVKTALHVALEKAEMTLADDAPLKLVARMKHGETVQMNYRGFGAFRHDDPGQQVSVTSRIYELELQQNGVVIWKRNAVHSAPHHLHLQEGESIQTAIDRIMTPRAENFAGRLPSYVVRPEFSVPLGTSTLSLGF
jgi:hypothetical protein